MINAGNCNWHWYKIIAHNFRNSERCWTAGVAVVKSTGNIVVVDAERRTVSVHAPGIRPPSPGVPLCSIQSDQLGNPTHVAVDNNGTIFVSDALHVCVKVTHSYCLLRPPALFARSVSQFLWKISQHKVQSYNNLVADPGVSHAPLASHRLLKYVLRLFYSSSPKPFNLCEGTCCPSPQNPYPPWPWFLALWASGCSLKLSKISTSTSRIIRLELVEIYC